MAEECPSTSETNGADFDFAAEAPRGSKFLPWAGFGLTALWLLLVGLYAASDWSELRSLKPNDMADFAAGAFAPLAFLWLVLGFFQQGEELRHSGRALWLQGRELQHSVEQQRELVNVTREQLQFESDLMRQQQEEISRNSQPKLSIIPGGSHSLNATARLFEFFLCNHGKPCTGIRLSYNGKRGASSDLLSSGSRLEFKIALAPDDISPIVVNVEYLDERLLPGTKAFHLEFINNGFEISELTDYSNMQP